MSHGEFMKILQAVEALRRAVGEDNMPVSDGAVARASALDDEVTAHKRDQAGSLCGGVTCPECMDHRLQAQGNALRLANEGVVIPEVVEASGE